MRACVCVCVRACVWQPAEWREQAQREGSINRVVTLNADQEYTSRGPDLLEVIILKQVSLPVPTVPTHLRAEKVKVLGIHTMWNNVQAPSPRLQLLNVKYSFCCVLKSDFI
ncbi:unnamed protein product [Boreogadus saida]